MSWFSTHPRVWRAGLLALLLVALIGPWAFDTIIVPSEYTCSPPVIRLEGNRCGTPLSGAWMLSWVFGALINTSVNFVRGTVMFGDWARELFVGLRFALVLMPLISTVGLITGRARRLWQVFQFVTWGLAAALGLWLIVSNYPRLPWALWGAWLYVATAVLMLILEAVTLMQERISRRTV